MLQPLAIQSSLETLLSTPDSPADVALIVLSESGAIYAQAHVPRHQVADQPDPSKSAILGEVDRLQRRNQPGLVSLMPLKAGSSSHEIPGHAGSAMAINLMQDERARVLAGVAAQAWTEELARLRRLQTNVLGRFASSGVGGPSSGPSLLSGASGSGSGLRPAALTKLSSLHEATCRGSPKQPGSRTNSVHEDETDDVSEGIDLPVATPGTALGRETGFGGDVAPLLFEGELGATLVMPLRPQNPPTSTAQSPATLNDAVHAPLLLVLSSRAPVTSQQEGGPTGSIRSQGTSTISLAEWNTLNHSAQSFAQYLAPALRKAFDRGGELLADEAHGIIHAGATTIFSDDRESLASVEASHILNGHAAAAPAHDGALSASNISVSS